MSFITKLVKKVSDIVQEIIAESETELSALSKGVLNLSAFAKRIQPTVERRALKSVRVGTIVVALSRFAKTLEIEDPLLPPIEIKSVAVKSALVEIAFDNTSENKSHTAELYAHEKFAQADFLAVTQGVGEIAIFAPESLVQNILDTFKSTKPKFLRKDLAALTLRLKEDSIDIPNVFFAIMRHLAVRKVNIIELVSTFAELTFLIDQKNLTEVFGILNSLMPSRPKGNPE